MKPHHRQYRDRLSALDLELMADAMKERIYAALALLAVLIAMDPSRMSVGHAALAVGGTALSLWAASEVSSVMARRMVFGQQDEAQFAAQRQRHAPLLASAALPLLLIGMAALRIISLESAIAVSIYAILLALVLWSLSAARSMRASGFATFVLASVVLLIGLGIVALKAVASH